MSAQVYINNRLAVHTGSEFVLTSLDVCYTGPHHVPVPYCNVAYCQDAANTSKRVFINGQAMCHQHSYFSRSFGDEAGRAGVRSGTTQGNAVFTSASHNVFIEQYAAVRHGDFMTSNNGNTNAMPLL